MGLGLAARLGSAFPAEAVFAWPGMAPYGVQTILRKDLDPTVGMALANSGFFLIRLVALAAGESIAKNLFEGSCDARWRYSAIVSPVPPASTGKSLSFGRPSRMGSTVSA